MSYVYETVKNSCKNPPISKVNCCKFLAEGDTSILSSIYKCVKLLHEGQISSAMQFSQLFVKSISCLQIPSFKWENPDRMIKLIITEINCLLIAFTLLGREPLDFTEVPNFICDVLLADKIDFLWEKYQKIKTKFAQTMREPDLVNIKLNEEKASLCGTAVLLQLSAPQLIAKIFLQKNINNINKDEILMTFMILNNFMNCALLNNKEQTIKEYYYLIKKAVNQITKIYPHYLIHQIRNRKPYDFVLLSIIASVSSKIIEFIIMSMSFTSFVVHAMSLLDTTNILPNGLAYNTFNLNKASIETCDILNQFFAQFCNNNLEKILQNVYICYFTSGAKAQLFNNLIQEAVILLTISLKNKNIDITPESIKTGDFIHFNKMITPNIYGEVKNGIQKFLLLLWQFFLITSIELLKGGVDFNSKIRLASCFIRCSIMGLNEQEELEFIQMGLSVLKKTNFKNFKNTTQNDLEALQDIGNAVELYTEKWEATIKEDKENILENIKKVSDLLLFLLEQYVCFQINWKAFYKGKAYK